MDSAGILAKTDLNLLVVFDTIAETRQITRASQRLHLTQPAISHALKRLRNMLGDPLFVKGADGMVPTPLAKELMPIIRDLLERIEKDVFTRQAFDPKSLHRTFHFYTTDFIESLLSARLAKSLEELAPHVTVAFVNTGFELPRQPMESGACDIAIAGFFGDLPDGFHQQKLFDDVLACAVRRDHPGFAKKATCSLDDYVRQRHLLISPGGTLTSALDKTLKAKNLHRHVVVGTSSFMVSGWILARSDAMLSAPSRLLRLFEDFLPLKTFPLPIKAAPLKIVQAWHGSQHADPAHRWMRQLVKFLLAEGES